LSAPLCISTILCQSEEVHLLLYLLRLLAQHP
jgi:hypothetical protein